MVDIRNSRGLYSVSSAEVLKLIQQEAQLLLGDRATRKHAKDS